LTLEGGCRILSIMTTTVTAKGAVVLPRKVLTQQKVRAGDNLEVIADSDEPGVIVLRRMPKTPQAGWVELLLACPEKGWFKPMPRRKERMRKVRL
jgi:bifunctional DNA-binding transcriptional regulator/antitoxin component of YhaV-PrlF toxin-antitoxin module